MVEFFACLIFFALWTPFVWRQAVKWIINRIKIDFPEQAEAIHQEQHRREGSVCARRTNPPNS
jgi:hypothetical protein